MTAAAPSAPSAPSAPRSRRSSVPTSRAGRWRRWWRRRPVNRGLVLVHRWAGLVLGLFLVAECTSGAILLYHAPLFRVTNANLYRQAAGPATVTPRQAIAIVARAHPGFDAQWVARDAGVYAVGNAAYETQWFVDPATGHVNGSGSLDRGFMGFLVNLHDCGFTCTGYPAYSSWLSAPVWSGGPTFLTGITWGGFVLGVLGLLMILLVLTSLKIWWPGLRRLGQRFAVRRGRGRFARDYDLHNVVGIVALPFLLMWGITGAALEFPVVEKAWLAITGGATNATTTFGVTPDPAARHRPMIDAATAIDVALDKAPGRMQFLGLPTKDAPYYEVDVVTGYASDVHRAIYGGDAYVYVDAHDAANVHVADGGTGPGPNRFYDKFLEPTHFGWNVNAWWRLIWLALGLTPLVLMITGVSTWLFRSRVKRRRRRAGRVPLPDTAIDPDRLERAGAPPLATVDPA